MYTNSPPNRMTGDLLRFPSFLTGDLHRLPHKPNKGKNEREPGEEASGQRDGKPEEKSESAGRNREKTERKRGGGGAL